MEELEEEETCRMPENPEGAGKKERRTKRQELLLLEANDAYC